MTKQIELEVNNVDLLSNEITKALNFDRMELIESITNQIITEDDVINALNIHLNRWNKRKEKRND